MTDFASTLAMGGRDSEATFRLPEYSPSDGDEIAEPETAPGTPETLSLLERHATLEIDDDESTSTVGLGEELERELSAMLTESPSPIPANRRALEGKTGPPRALTDYEANTGMCGGASAAAAFQYAGLHHWLIIVKR